MQIAGFIICISRTIARYRNENILQTFRNIHLACKIYSVRFPVCGQFVGETFNLKAHNFISTCLTGVLKNAIVAVLSLAVVGVRAAFYFLSLPFAYEVLVSCYSPILLFQLSSKIPPWFQLYALFCYSDDLHSFFILSQLVHFINSDIMTDVLINLNSFIILQYTGWTLEVSSLIYFPIFKKVGYERTHTVLSTCIHLWRKLRGWSLIWTVLITNICVDTNCFKICFRHVNSSSAYY